METFLRIVSIFFVFLRTQKRQSNILKIRHFSNHNIAKGQHPINGSKQQDKQQSTK